MASSDANQFFSPLRGSQNPLSKASSVSIDFPGNTHSVLTSLLCVVRIQVYLEAPASALETRAHCEAQVPGSSPHPKFWDKGLIGSFPFSMILHPCYWRLVLPG